MFQQSQLSGEPFFPEKTWRRSATKVFALARSASSCAVVCRRGRPRRQIRPVLFFTLARSVSPCLVLVMVCRLGHPSRQIKTVLFFILARRVSSCLVVCRLGRRSRQTFAFARKSASGSSLVLPGLCLWPPWELPKLDDVSPFGLPWIYLLNMVYLG